MTANAPLHHRRHNFSIYFYHIYLTYFSSSQTGNSSAAPGLGVGGVGTHDDLLLGGAAAASQPLDAVSAALGRLGPLLSGAAEPAVLAFVPQLVLLVAVSVRLHDDLPTCWLALTMAFVAFNKVLCSCPSSLCLAWPASTLSIVPGSRSSARKPAARRASPSLAFATLFAPLKGREAPRPPPNPAQVCTAQYFVWWLFLLPLVLHHVPRPVPPALLAAAAAWVAAQLHWLAWAYLLEFQVRRA